MRRIYPYLWINKGISGEDWFFKLCPHQRNEIRTFYNLYSIDIKITNELLDIIWFIETLLIFGNQQFKTLFI